MPRTTITLQSSEHDVAGLQGRPYMEPGDLDALIQLVASVAPRVVVEFGCNAGRTAVAILRNVVIITGYVGIDVEPGYAFALGAQRKELPRKPGEFAMADGRFKLLTRPRGSYDLRATDLPACDVAFIDGEHSRDGVLNDYALAKAITRPGGIIIFHDDNGLPEVQVTQTLDELADGGANIVHVDGTWLSFEMVN